MYRDRREAGRELAKHLDAYRDKDALVLALPRGGVEVGYEMAEDVVCPMTPSPFRAIGVWYGNFEQTSDERVIELLRQRRLQAARQS